MKHNLIITAILFISVLILGDCASTGHSHVAYRMYDGPELLPTQVAFVFIEETEGWDITLRTVDGKTPPAGARRIAVLPGRHVIVIDVVLTKSSDGMTTKIEGYKNIELDATAGAFYVIEEGNIRQVEGRR